MRVLEDHQKKNLWRHFTSWRSDDQITIINLTLTFDNQSRRTLRHDDQNWNKYVSEGRKLMMRMSRQRKVHVFGYIATETNSISSKTEELVGAHLHILMAVKFDHIAPLISQDDIAHLWKWSSAEQVVVQAWDGDNKLINYNYGTFPDHFHDVTITSVFHPRRASCRNGTCETCTLFPTPSSILEWETKSSNRSL